MLYSIRKVVKQGYARIISVPDSLSHCRDLRITGLKDRGEMFCFRLTESVPLKYTGRKAVYISKDLGFEVGDYVLIYSLGETLVSQ